MSILSITFHSTESVLAEWQQYVSETLTLMAENLIDAEKYILSEVESEMINEGKNYNLLLVFENDEIRNEFIESELENIRERVEQKFGENVMIFLTFLNPITSRF